MPKDQPSTSGDAAAEPSSLPPPASRPAPQDPLPPPAPRPAPAGLLARALHMEWRGFSLVAGAVAALLLGAIVWAARQFGQPGLFAGMGVLQGTMAALGAPPALRPRVAAIFAAFGAGATMVAVVAVGAPDSRATAVAVGAVAFVAALGGAFGPATGRVGNALAIWFAAAMSLVDVRVDARFPVLGFLSGALVVALLAEAMARRAAGPTPIGPSMRHVRDQLRWPSPVIRFAVVFALAATASWLLGERFVPRHASWVAMTAMLLLRPDATGPLVTMLQRLAGTLFGAMAAVAIIGRITDPRLLVALLLGAAFGMAATLKVNYAVFATCLTVLVVSLAALLGDDPARASNDRLLATAIGAAVALVGMAALRIWGLAIDGRPGRHASELA